MSGRPAEAEKLRMALIQQQFEQPCIADVTAHVKKALAVQMPIGLPEGSPVAIAVGSRGIDHIADITHMTVQFLKQQRLSPYLVPAMGSHGGATAEGQLALLAELGITQESMGAPIEPSMDAFVLCETTDGQTVYFAKSALRAKAIIPINRVKAHTNFRGEVESGLCKMLAVGLGKQKGAAALHSGGLAHMGDAVQKISAEILKRVFVPFGIAIVENALDNPAVIECVAGERMLKREQELLILAKSLAASIPFSNIDVLIVEKMGKEISGDGMDTNVIGRYSERSLSPLPATPHISTITVLGLSAQSHGNAIGVGYADYTTMRLKNSIDFSATYANAITAGAPAACKIPIALGSDLDCISTAIQTTPQVDGSSARVVLIQNTLNLEYMYISKALEQEASENSRVRLLRPAFSPLRFNGEGALDCEFPSRNN